MTDSALRDAAEVELKQTTLGWSKVKSYPPEKLATTHWGKGLDLLAQVSSANAAPRNAAVVYLKKTTKGYSPTATNWKLAFAELAKIKDGAATDWKVVAGEGQSFALAAQTTVRYGKGTTWTSKALAPGTYLCGNALFGDPLVGTTKECQVPSNTPPPPLPSNVARSAPTALVTA